MGEKEEEEEGECWSVLISECRAQLDACDDVVVEMTTSVAMLTRRKSTGGWKKLKL